MEDIGESQEKPITSLPFVSWGQLVNYFKCCAVSYWIILFHKSNDKFRFLTKPQEYLYSLTRVFSNLGWELLLT